MILTGSPTRLPAGLATSPPPYFYNSFPRNTPPEMFVFFDDFYRYAAGDWTVTSAGGGSSALTDYVGGALLLTTGGTETNTQGNMLTTKCMAFESNCRVWFSVNAALSDATQTTFLAGIADTFADATTTDGVYFSKVDGSTTMNLLITNTGTSTTIPVGTMADATEYAFSFFYDAAPSPTLYIYSTIPYTDGSLTGPTAFGQPYFQGGAACVASANANGGTSSTGAYVLTNLPAAATKLRPGVLLITGETGANTATLDYLFAAQDIVTRY